MTHVHCYAQIMCSSSYPTLHRYVLEDLNIRVNYNFNSPNVWTKYVWLL